MQHEGRPCSLLPLDRIPASHQFVLLAQKVQYQAKENAIRRAIYMDKDMTDKDINTKVPEPEIFPRKKVKITYQDGDRKRGFSLPPFVAGLLVVLFAILLITSLILLLSGKSDTAKKPELDELQAENRELRGKIMLYSAQADSILAKIDTLKSSLDTSGKKESKRNYPYVKGSGSSYNMNPGQDKDLKKIYAAIEAKYNIIYARLGSDAPAALNLANPDQSFARSGDGIPSIYPTFGRYSDSWGIRIHPISNELEFHAGIDISNEIGTPVYATADGIVRLVSYENGYGKRIIVTHNESYETQYAHLYSFQVSEGDRVRKGQIIGLMGNTGLSTGPHLHYEVIENGDKVNPIPFLNRIDTDHYAGI
jgi:murein DD-endopeptidase MepM/ murein hydrolase activator NlpD